MSDVSNCLSVEIPKLTKVQGCKNLYTNGKKYFVNYNDKFTEVGKHPYLKNIWVSREGYIFFINNKKTRSIKHRKVRYFNTKYFQVRVYIPTGERYRNGAKKYWSLNVPHIILETFVSLEPTVNELKIRMGMVDDINLENTIIIAEHIDRDIYNNCVENLRWNFIKRGERHWNHKLTNSKVLKIRIATQNHFIPFNYYRLGENYTIREFKKIIGADVSDSTISRVINGYSWRVRVQPYAEMTYPMENYPNSKCA